MILGGDDENQPARERLSPAQMRARLEARTDVIDDYNAHAQIMGKYFLALYLKYPRLAGYPIDSILLRDGNGKPIWDEAPLVVGLDKIARREYPDKNHPFRQALDQASGFSYGWAVNMARYALGLDMLPNPAHVALEAPT